MRIAFYFLAAWLGGLAAAPVAVVPSRFAGFFALDGRADEAAWQNVAVVRIKHGEVRAGFDDQHIYIAISATAPGSIVLTVNEKRYTIASDGKRGDPMDLDTGGKPADVDSQWLAAVLSTPEGWSAEIKIPAAYTSRTRISVELQPRLR